jgi:ABC-type dipeptide/oligopeptide/nickel transport system permease subunit
MIPTSITEFSSNLRKSRFFKRLKRNRRIQAGITIITSFILIAFLAPVIVPHDPYVINTELILDPPSQTHLLGTDQLGRDLLSRLLFGARLSLIISFYVTIISLVSGIFLGTCSGYIGGRVDKIIMVFLDIMLAFPSILLAITILTALGPGLYNVMIAVGIWSIPSFSRFVRSAVLSIKENEYVLAAKGIGESGFNIVARYILPNCIGPILVQLTLRMGSVILVSSSLSFLGLGIQPPKPEWGVMISELRSYMLIKPYFAIVPGVMITLVVVGFNLLGEGLSDILNVRLRD